MMDDRQRRLLVREVKKSDIDRSLKSIHINKAPDCDGMNPYFFKAIWSWARTDICKAVLNFFDSYDMYRPINYTTITLIPKSPHASSISQYRPILCCTILYKLITKVLASRIQEVICSVIDPAQSGFIPDCQLLDNVLLASD